MAFRSTMGRSRRLRRLLLTSVVSPTPMPTPAPTPTPTPAPTPAPTPTPTPTPTLTIAGPLTYTSGTYGALVFNIGNVPAGVAPTLSPNDGRIFIAGDAATGWKAVVGMTAATAGARTYTVSAVGANSASADVVVTAASAVVPLAYEPEAQAYFAAYDAAGPAMPARHKYFVNRLVKRGKAKGWWAQAARSFGGLYLADVAETAAQAVINLVDLNRPLVMVGAPVFSSRSHWTFPTGSDWLNTGVPLSAIPQNDNHQQLFVDEGVASTSSDMGAFNGSAGITMGLGSGSPSIRMGSTAATVGSTGQFDRTGHYCASRTSATEYQLYCNGTLKATQTAASTDLSASGVTFAIGKINGTTTPSPRKIRQVSIGAGLTEAQARDMYGAMRTLSDAIRHGAPMMTDAGVGSAIIETDFLAYGWTLQSHQWAQGLCRTGVAASRVMLVGGWRDQSAEHLGAVSTNGLGGADASDQSAFGGFGRRTFNNARARGGQDTSGVVFRPRLMTLELWSQLDSAKGGYDIPVVAGNGVASARKYGARGVELTMTDGRIIRALKGWADGSYELDLAFKLGLTTTYGRESSALEGAPAGFRGISTANSGNEKQFARGSTLYNISPYNVVDDPSSGLLPGVLAMPNLAIGDADLSTQSYNFRTVLVNASNIPRRITWSTNAPAGFIATKYEPLLRLMAKATAGGSAAQLTDMMLFNNLSGGYFDQNADGGMSTNLWGGANEYVAAQTYAEREVVWKKHETWQRGFYHILTAYVDSRIPAAIQTAFNAYGLANDHYLDPHANDEMFWSGQLYIRVFRRIVGDLVWLRQDLAGAGPGSVPRSTKIVACGSYPMDNHHHNMFCDTSTTPHRIWNSGQFFAAGNSKAPLPMEIFLPKQAESTSGCILFGASASNVAFGEVRMELTTAVASYNLGVASALAANDNVAILDRYDAMRAAVIAEADVPASYLPQAFAA